MLEKIFGLKQHNASLKTEIIGGLVTFVAMCYILPINASILGQSGMDPAGVFTMTAIISFIVTMIMGMVANYPIVLSAGMGLNAYFTYTLCMQVGFSWQESMMVLTIAGLLFFAFSLTPVRKMIIEAIPADLKAIISCALGVFIAFVGLRNSGIIVGGATLVELGNFANPGMLIAILTVILCFGLMFIKNKTVSNLAIPIAILIAAIAGVTVSTIMINNGSIVETGGLYVYQGGALDGQTTTLPIAPWISGEKWGLQVDGVRNVFFYGLLSDGGSFNFGESLVKVLTTPATYVAIFSLMFVNLFDTTATLLAVGKNTGIIDENGKMQNYRRAVLADATGALICAPMGTSTVTSFAESNVGVSMGAKTGLAAVVAALMFLLSAFIYPVFSIFTAGSVTAPALVCVGAMIFVGNFKDINLKDPVSGFTAIITVLFALLSYSIANGIGIGLICYVVMMLFSKRAKEVQLPIYIIAGLFVVSFAMNTIMQFL